ncbi:hypothetical protein BIU97_14125 [Curtobacterium sp. MCBA15_009]|nr:hypothetical protein BIU97_14125 [Curtobacterium sp. MCBA15_009]
MPLRYGRRMTTDDDLGNWRTWCVGGAVASFVALLVLGRFVPVNWWVLTAWVAVVAAFTGLPPGSARWTDRRVTVIALALLVVGAGLALGALTDDGAGDGTRTTGAVTGAVLVLAGAAWAIVGARRPSRRQVDAEAEHHRA